ncbi:MAG: hypothetical protein RIT42_896 [Bacteroidota bacterium]
MALHFTIIRWRNSGDFFELIRQMGHAAVIQFPGQFGDCERALHKQFFRSFNFMFNDKMFNRDPHRPREQIRNIMILFAQAI